MNAYERLLDDWSKRARTPEEFTRVAYRLLAIESARSLLVMAACVWAAFEIAERITITICGG